MIRKIFEWIKKAPQPNVLYITARMQGNLTFTDPVDLRIDGVFQGSLNSKGDLFIGKNATVKANITGDNVIVAGKVMGNITCAKELRLLSPSNVNGDIRTPSLSVERGSFLQGRCQMHPEETMKQARQILMTPAEVADYLEVDIAKVKEWADSGKVPVIKENDEWRFDRTQIDKWIIEQSQS